MKTKLNSAANIESFRALMSTIIWRDKDDHQIIILQVHRGGFKRERDTFGKGKTFNQAFIDLMGKLGVV